MAGLSPPLGVAIMMNNYFHDVATAMLAASGAALWIMLKEYEKNGGGADEYFMKIYGRMAAIARFSLLWILIGGVPRTLFYRDYEWANAVYHRQAHALIAKHFLAFLLVSTGVYVWLKLTKKIEAVKNG